MKKIYIKLLNEGTIVYKPVFAKKITNLTYLITAENDYDADLEEWEFAPGTIVNTQLMKVSDEMALVAQSSVN